MGKTNRLAKSFISLRALSADRFPKQEAGQSFVSLSMRGPQVHVADIVATRPSLPPSDRACFFQTNVQISSHLNVVQVQPPELPVHELCTSGTEGNHQSS